MDNWIIFNFIGTNCYVLREMKYWTNSRVKLSLNFSNLCETDWKRKNNRTNIANFHHSGFIHARVSKEPERKKNEATENTCDADKKISTEPDKYLPCVDITKGYKSAATTQRAWSQ